MPDDPDVEARFKTISAAFDILKDPETRARCDAGEIEGLGAERTQRRYYRDSANTSDNAYRQRRGFGLDAGPADIFADILRNHARSPERNFGDTGFSAAGPDASNTLEVPILDAVRGSETRITMPDGQGLAVRIPHGTEDGQTLRLRSKGRPASAAGMPGTR